MSAERGIVPQNDSAEHNHHTRGDHLKPPGRCPACDAARGQAIEPQNDPPEVEFVPAGVVWLCSTRCWQEGGPHDETCRATVLYERRIPDA